MDSKNTIKKNRRTPRVFISVFLVILLTYLLIWLLSGRIALSYLSDYLEQQEISVSEDARIEFNPFLTKIRFENIEFTKNGSQPFKLKHLELELTLTDLVSKTITIDKLSIEGLNLYASQKENKLTVAGIDIPPKEPTAEQSEPDETEEPFNWEVNFPQFQIRESAINFAQTSRNDRVNIEHFSLADTKFSSDLFSTNLSIRFLLNQAPLILESQASVSNPLDTNILKAKVQGMFDLSEFNFESYASFLPDTIKALNGQLGTKSDFDLSYEKQQATLSIDKFLLALKNNELQAENASAALTQLNFSLSDLEFKVKDLDNETPNLYINGTPALSISGLHATAGEALESFESQKINVDLGETSVEVIHQSETPSISLAINESAITLDGLNLQAQPILMTSAKQHLDLQSLTLQKTGDSLTVNTAPAWHSENTQLFLNRDNNFLAGWERATLPMGEVSLTPSPVLTFPNFNFESLKVSNPSREELTRPIVHLNDFGIQHINMMDNHLSIEQIALNQLDTELILDAARAVYNLVDTKPANKVSQEEELATNAEETSASEIASTEPEETLNAPQKEKSFSFSLKEFVITPNSKFKLVDRMTTPWYEYTVDIDQYKLGPIDSRYPENETNLLFQAHSGEYAKFELKGYLKPLLPNPEVELKATIKEFPLSPKSFYIKDSLGYEIESGELDTNLSVSIADNKIEGNTHIIMRSLELIPAESVDVDSVDSGAISLNMAIGMLKDGNGIVDVSVPMSGDLDNPEFGLGGFISIILKQAMMEAAKNYLVKSMVPYANVVSIAMIAGDQAFKLRFEPLIYSPELVEITPDQETYLKQFNEVLTQNKEQIIRMCAVSVPADIGVVLTEDLALDEVQKKQLIEIGYQREKALKKYLVAKGLDSSRLQECKPKIDTEKDAKPRIELET